MIQRIEIEVYGVRIINYPGDQPILARWAVERIMHLIPEAIKTMIVVDYSKIDPEIFQPIKIGITESWTLRALDLKRIWHRTIICI